MGRYAKNLTKDTNSSNVVSNEQNNEQNDEILNILKAMQSEIQTIKESNNQLKEENEKLVKQNEELKKSEKTVVYSENVSNDIEQKLDPNMEVAIVNMFDGLVFNLKINDMGAIKTLNRFGQKIWVTLREARDIVRLNDKFARTGYFIFEDRDIVKALYLDEDYEKFVDLKTLNKLPDLEVRILEDVFKNANQMYKEKIINKFIDEWLKGQDARFRDPKKIDLLSEWSDMDIMLKISETEKARRILEQ